MNFLLPESLLFLELCNPFCSLLSDVPSEEGWHYISELSKLHGVTPFLYYRTRSLGIKLPDQIEKEWLGIYLYQIAEEKKARRQIKELKEILDPEGIPFILLKGASAMLCLYPQPGLRTFVDLDILIPVDKTSQFKRTMKMAGYEPLAITKSPEDEELQRFEEHLNPFWKQETIMIEPHLSILAGKGGHLVGLPEIWKNKEEINTDGIIFGHLSKEQFIVHTLLHSSKHLSNGGFVEIKGLIDVLYGIKTWSIDWSKVRDFCRRCGVEKKIFPLMATLTYYWQAEIPLAGEGTPLDLHALTLGVEGQAKQSYSKVPARYIKRLIGTRQLPDKTSQVRYVFHLFFPTRDNLRWRYNLPTKRLIAPYYFIHLLDISKKFFVGLCHQFLYHLGR